jgi:hypothetical protein
MAKEQIKADPDASMTERLAIGVSKFYIVDYATYILIMRELLRIRTQWRGHGLL